MALLNLIGFETGDFSEVTGGFALGSSTHSVQNSVVRSGAYAYRSTAVGTDLVGTEVHIHDSTAKINVGSYAALYATFWLRIASYPASTAARIAQFYSTTGNNPLVLKLTSTGTLQLFNLNGGAQVGSDSSALSLDTWYRVDLMCDPGADASSGVLEARLDEVSFASSSSADAGTDPLRGSVRIGAALATGSSCDLYFDDLILDDAAWHDGEIRVTVAVPTGDSASNTNWSASTGNKWETIDEIPPSNTDYIESLTTAGDRRYSATHATAATLGITGDILGVKVVARMWEPTSTTTLGAIGIRSGSTNFETTNVDIGNTTAITMAVVHGVDPNTSAAWTSSGFNAAEPLVKRSTSDTSNIRCGALYLMVAWVEETAVNATVTGETATATAAGVAGTVAAIRTATITGARATATSAGVTASVVAVRIATITGAPATATAAGIAATVQVARTITGELAEATAEAIDGAVLIARAVTGEPAEATAAAIEGTAVAVRAVAVTGTVATANAVGLAGSVAVARVVTGETATATAEALAGAVLIARTIPGETAEATADGIEGAVATIRIVTVTGAVAAAAASAIAGAVEVFAEATITGEVAAATSAALPGSVSVARTVTGEIAAASAEGLAGVAAAQVTATIAGEPAEATAVGVAGTVTTVRVATITGAVAEATAAALPGAFTGGAVVSVTGSIAEAEAAGIGGTVAAVRIVSITGTVAGADAAAIGGVLSAIRIVTITGAVAQSDAESVAATVAAIRISTVVGAVALANAAGIAGAATAIRIAAIAAAIAQAQAAALASRSESGTPRIVTLDGSYTPSSELAGSVPSQSLAGSLETVALTGSQTSPALTGSHTPAQTLKGSVS